ncbi:MAG: putative bifunctional diguanylate cyclase/phosphodiesterase [Pyrinomonadaceae bacterium]
MLKKEKIITRLLWIFLLISGIAGVFAVSEYKDYQFETILICLSGMIVGCGFYGWLVNKFKNIGLEKERSRAARAESYIEELQHYITEQEEITKNLQQSKEKFHHAAFHDLLTNLPNRNLFIETLKFLLEKVKQTPGYNFAVLYLDLNRFKTINESLGHSTGDKLILHVAKRLTNFIREGDLVARFGGDKFAVILSNIKNIEDAVIFAERVQEKISEPFILGGRQIFTGVSIGIAFGSTDYAEAEEILRDADMAMYYAKDHEKHYEIFNPQMHTRAVKLLEIETDLRCAVERNELRAFFQPIVDLDSMKLYGFEALIRWQHPQRGLISPNEFIPVSEETGAIVPITLWMLRHCCEQFVKWQQKSQLNKNLVLSINLSGKHFAEENLVQQIGQILFDTSLDPGCLKIEITESAMMENPKNVISMLIQLKSLGIRLSIDDFGTGYSSLSYLHRFPVDTLKVDRSFVSAMDEGSENGEIVRTIVSLAKILGMNIIAEGIETIHQLHQLRILGCEYGQGYLFSRPVPVKEAEKFLENRDCFRNILPAREVVIPPQKHEMPHLRLAK